MKFQKKSISKIALTDLLRRKRTNLAKYLTDNGIFSYELLVTRCASIGVICPTEIQFLKERGIHTLYEISSPTEGIVVLNSDLLHTESEALNIPLLDSCESNTQNLILQDDISNVVNEDKEAEFYVATTETDEIKKFSRKFKNKKSH